MNFKPINKAPLLNFKDNIIEITSPHKTDFFIDPGRKYRKLNAPFYFTSIKNDFILRCRVEPSFKHVYDAGGLLVYESKSEWIKFVFELTDLGYTSIVSVVNNKVSDDSNGEKIIKKYIWLQIARKDDNWGLHFSNNGKTWKMARYFRLKLKPEVKIGLISQSPGRNGCRTKFINPEVLKCLYNDIRKGV